MTTQAQVGGIADVFSGSPGKILAANGWDIRALRPYIRDNKPLRANDLLRKDEWKALDDALVEVARRQVGAVEDLIAAGVTRNLGSLGVMIDEYEALSSINDAEVIGYLADEASKARFRELNPEAWTAAMDVITSS